MSRARLQIAHDLDEPPADRAELRAWLANDPARAATLLDLVEPPEVAALLRVSESTLANWRAARRGPRFLRIGSRPLYRREDICLWVASRLTGTREMPLR